MGAGGGFDFLIEDNKPKSPSDFVDQGFTQDQMQLLEDTEMVTNPYLPLLLPSPHILTPPSLPLHLLFSFSQIVDQRNAEIVKIAKSIEELAQIFRELAVLVIDQGTILDRIDYNMENAVQQTKEGMEHLTKAEEHQKNSLGPKCIVLLVILIAIMIGVLAWKHQKK